MKNFLIIWIYSCVVAVCCIGAIVVGAFLATWLTDGMNGFVGCALAFFVVVTMISLAVWVGEKSKNCSQKDDQ